MKINTCTLAVGIHFTALALASSYGQSTVQFSRTNYIVAESGVTASIYVERSGDTNTAVTVDYVTSNGTATGGNDYVAQAGTLMFAAGQTNQTLTIQILDDGRVEADETVNLTLSNPSSGASLGTGSTSVLTILDNERPGSFDSSFAPGSPFWGYALSALQPDGKIIISELDCNGGGSVYRLNADGSLDANFVSATDACGGFSIRLVMQSDGKILAACPPARGQFGFHPPHFIRMNADGSLDPSFNPATTNIYSVALEPDGKIIISGDFSTVSGQPSNRIARLNADGSLDPSFVAANTNGGSPFVLLQPDGKVIIQAQATGGFMRLNSDGSLDNSFASGAGVPFGYYRAVLLQADGKILVMNYSGDPRYQVFRVNADGSLDESFTLDGRISSAAGSMALQRDGKILMSAGPSGYPDKLIRLYGDGSIDDSFDSGAVYINDSSGIHGGTVYSILVQDDGRVLFAGDFNSVDGVPRPGIARLNGDCRYIKLSPPTRLPSNEVRLAITSQPGKSYVLQGSSNLVDWIPVTTNMAAGYSLEFREATASTFPRRFYQVLLLSP